MSSAPIESASTVINLDPLYAELVGASPADRTQRLAAMASLNLSDFYQSMLQAVDDKPVQINGVVISNVATRLRQQGQTFAALSATYGTIGNYWRAIHHEPTSTISYSQYQTLNANLTKVVAASGRAMALVGEPNLEPSAHPTLDLPDLELDPELAAFFNEHKILTTGDYLYGIKDHAAAVALMNAIEAGLKNVNPTTDCAFNIDANGLLTWTETSHASTTDAEGNLIWKDQKCGHTGYGVTAPGHAASATVICNNATGETTWACAPPS